MQIRTRVYRTKKFDKQLANAPKYIQEKVTSWIFLTEVDGLWEVMKSRGYHDEPLQGARSGQRSIRLNRSYRLIYRVIIDRIHIELLEVHKHDY